MKIGLIDVDGHNFPNLALMKISAYHKRLGDDVEWWFGDMFYYDTEEQDLYRIYRLRELGYDPYVMVYDKPHASRRVKQMQRWVNNKYIWNSCYTFEEYLDK